MTWFDAVVFILVGAVAWLESNRGFGRAIFDVIGAIVVLRITISLAGPLAHAIPLSQAEGTSQAIWLVGVFVVLIALVVIGSRFLYETTLLSLDVLDPVVGGALGVAAVAVTSWPTWVALSVVLLVLCAASDAWSLSATIEASPVLRRLDDLGKPRTR